MAAREKLVAAGEAGFISVKALTPEKPKGTFMPLVETPRRSPRLAAKRVKERCHNQAAAVAPHGLPTPTRDAIRRTVQTRGHLNLLEEVQ